MALAKELMLSFAIGGSSNKNAKNLGGAEATSDQTKAALRIWGYGPKSNIKDCHEQELFTIDQSIKRTLNAFQKNNFGIVNSLHAPIGEGVYPCAALLNHSCAPNCILRYELGRSGNLKYHPPILQIIACKDIVKGEELTHSYVDLALCTQERQSRLMETHGFECNCIRCNHTGCLVEMPEDKKDWDMWPLKNMFEKLEQARSGGNIKSTNNLVKVNLEDAMVGSSGLGKAEQFNIIQHSRTLQENANRCMMEGDEEGEMVHLSRAISLFPKRAECPAWFSPFHVQLYSIRCVYLSALLANGHIHEAVEQCEHIVSFLAVAFSHVTNHPCECSCALERDNYLV